MTQTPRSILKKPSQERNGAGNYEASKQSGPHYESQAREDFYGRQEQDSVYKQKPVHRQPQHQIVYRSLPQPVQPKKEDYDPIDIVAEVPEYMTEWQKRILWIRTTRAIKEFSQVAARALEVVQNELADYFYEEVSNAVRRGVADAIAASDIEKGLMEKYGAMLKEYSDKHVAFVNARNLDHHHDDPKMSEGFLCEIEHYNSRHTAFQAILQKKVDEWKERQFGITLYRLASEYHEKQEEMFAK